MGCAAQFGVSRAVYSVASPGEDASAATAMPFTSDRSPRATTRTTSASLSIHSSRNTMLLIQKLMPLILANTSFYDRCEAVDLSRNTRSDK